MIEFININKKYNDKTIFKDLNLKIESYGLYLLKGDNGSGKTTFFNLLTSFDNFDNGQIKVNREEVNKETYDKYIYYYNVDFNLVDYLEVKDNLNLYPKEKVNKLIKEFGLEDQMNHKVSEISKGEKARVGIIKALLSSKEIILLDEPFAYLDLKTSKLVFSKLKEYAKNHIVIFSDHYFNEYKINELNILNINNQSIEFTFNSVENIAKNIENKPTLSNKNFAKHSFFIFFKHLARSIVSLIAILISTTILFTSLNFCLTSKSSLYNEIIDHYDILYGEVNKKDFGYYKIQENEYYTKIDNNLKLNNKEEGGIPLSTNFYISSSNKVVFDKEYEFTNHVDNKLSLIVSKRFFSHYSLSLNDTLFLELDNDFAPLNNRIICSIDGVIEELENENMVFFNAADFLSLLNNKVFIVSTNQFGFNEVIEKMNLNTWGDGLISYKNEIDSLVSYSSNYDIKDNEVNLILLNSYVNSFGKDEFDKYFNDQIKDTILTSSDSNNKSGYFDLLSIEENLTIKGYKVIDESKLLPYVGYSGIEISSELDSKLDKLWPNNSLIFNSPSSVIIPRSYLLNIGAQNKPMVINHISKENGVTIPYTDFIVLEAKDTYQIIFMVISVILIIISLAFFYTYSINLIKENSKNFYSLLKDSFSNHDIFMILNLGQFALFTLGIVAGLILSIPTSILLNSILESTTTLAFHINYFAFSFYNFLILFVVIFLIVIINKISFNLLVSKKTVNDLVSTN